MITPSHLIYSWALAHVTNTNTPEQQRSRRSQLFILGTLLPDVPTYLLFVVHTFFIGTSQHIIWSTIYFDSAWTPVITLSHSLWVWPLLIATGYALGKQWLVWLASSATVHIGLDFLVHADDAYRHFWPLSDWKFESPISYWDPRYYGAIVGLVDTIIILLVLTWLFTKYTTRTIRVIIIVTTLIYLLITFTPIMYVVFN